MPNNFIPFNVLIRLVLLIHLFLAFFSVNSFFFLHSRFLFFILLFPVSSFSFIALLIQWNAFFICYHFSHHNFTLLEGSRPIIDLDAPSLAAVSSSSSSSSLSSLPLPLPFSLPLPLPLSHCRGDYQPCIDHLDEALAVQPLVPNSW